MLDLIFQNGEFSPSDSSLWQDLLTSAIGAAIGAGGALFVYWLQIQRERDLKAITQYTQNKADINYFKLVLKDALAFVDVQSKERMKYAERIKASPYETEPLNSYPTLPLVRLEKIDHEKTHHLFLVTQGAEATELFKETYKYIDFFSKSFDAIDTTLVKDTNEIQNLKQEYIKQFADLIDAASKKTNKIKHEVYEGDISYKHDVLFSLIEEIIATYHENKKDTTDLSYHQTHFVRKLNESIVLGGFFGDADCLNLALSSKTATHLFSDIKFKVYGLADYLERYCKALEKEFGNFTNSTNKIIVSEQLITRRWYHVFYEPGQ